MLVKDIKYEDFVNYKIPSMTIQMPYCDFKCNIECSKDVCHNKPIKELPSIDVPIDGIINRYLSNPITSSIVFQGLEPLYVDENINSFNEVLTFINKLRSDNNCDDDIVIYTGYTEKECEEKGFLEKLRKYKNIIVKFGRFIPDDKPHLDKVLDVVLASSNQYAKQIS